jgi:DNA-binding MarR family transcriptional regulator
LRLTVGARTTTDLASELAISAATVSGHTKALRAAGLIVTTRAGKAVQHSVTPLGSMLVDNAVSSCDARQPGHTAPGRNPSLPHEQPGPQAGQSLQHPAVRQRVPAEALDDLSERAARIATGSARAARLIIQ